MRTAGILLPVSSLPSGYGIGSISKEAYEFIDFLHRSGQGAWQVLPIGPTGFSNSPYQPLSAFAGNPYFISLEELVGQGFLNRDEVNASLYGDNPERIDYGAVYRSHPALLKLASTRFFEQGEQRKSEYTSFVKKAVSWLPDYAMFMALKDLHNGEPWTKWEEGYKKRVPEVMEKAEIELQEQIVSYYFEQYIFRQQWKKLYDYAHEKKIRLIGDVPFYIAEDSADCWAHPELFDLDENGKPVTVDGCPPDAQCASGQRWGNPTYNWKKQKEDDYAWWGTRIKHVLTFFDVIRIDHFGGFAEYYQIPYDAENAENGVMKNGPGMDFVQWLMEMCRPEQIIAEDLGRMTAAKEKLMKDSGFAGMHVLQYAFNNINSAHLTHRHTKNSAVYTGTHDNTTLRAYIESMTHEEREYARNYVGSVNTDYGQFTWDLIREAYRSVADLCIVPLQDYLVLGADTRINNPADNNANWCWRLREGSLSEALSSSIRNLAGTYGRVPREEMNP